MRRSRGLRTTPRGWRLTTRGGGVSSKPVSRKLRRRQGDIVAPTILSTRPVGEEITFGPRHPRRITLLLVLPLPRKSHWRVILRVDLVGRLPLDIHGIDLVERALQGLSCETCAKLEGLGHFRVVLPTAGRRCFMLASIMSVIQKSHCCVILLTCNRYDVVSPSRRDSTKYNYVAFTGSDDEMCQRGLWSRPNGLCD